MSLLFTAMLSHSYVPQEMLISSLVPIPKNLKKSLGSSDNYRSIAIGSILGKVLDNVFIEKHSTILQSSNLQFGFKARHSTVQCSFAVQEVIEYFVQHSQQCHVILLDASRAFDRVNYIKLFDLLRKRGLCPTTISILIQMYTTQSMHVTWAGNTSQPFQCSNGVKQGGVLSPLLFCVYMDELIDRLRSSDIGCYIGGSFVGAFGYADDLTLLSPSVVGARHLVAICESFAKEFDVIFNTAKSAHLIFGLEGPNGGLLLNGIAIPKVDKAQLLGSCIGSGQADANFSKAIGDMTYRCNLLLARFKFSHSSTLSRLFSSFCTSFYGSPLWPLDLSCLKRLGVSWRRCLKRVWRISLLTHSVLIPLVNKCPSLHTQLLLRFASFISSIVNSNNPIVNLLYSVASKSMSTVALNIRLLCETLLVPSLSDFPLSKLKTTLMTISNCTVDVDNYCTAIAIHDLCAMRDQKKFHFFTREELDFLILHLCTS